MAYCQMCADKEVEISTLRTRAESAEAEVARLREELSTERSLSMDPSVPDAHWCDEDGKEYTLKWDYGDPSVGIWPGYACEELDALCEEAKRLREAVDAMPGWIAVIKAERMRQDDKWGEQNHDDFKWLAILTEEVGELAKAILENDPKGVEELTHCAAVCVQWMDAIRRRAGSSS